MVCIVKEVKRGKEFLTQRSAEGSAKERREERRGVGGRLFLPPNYGRRKKRGKGVCERLVFCNAMQCNAIE
jgi:hypothetical protein